MRIESLRAAIDCTAQLQQFACFQAGGGPSVHFSAKFDSCVHEFEVASTAIGIRLQSHLKMAATLDDAAGEITIADEVATLDRNEPRDLPFTQHLEVRIERRFCGW